MKNTRSFRIARYIIYRQTILEPKDHLWTFLGAFLGISLVGLFQQSTFESLSDGIFLVGSFGASAVLIYGATNSPLAQPRNLVGGHLVSSIVGVTVAQIIPNQHYLWLASGLAVALAIVAMQITKTMHPPGGATALIANIGSAKIKALGYWYVLFPIMSSVMILLLVAIVVNNLPANRSYPYKRRRKRKS